MNAPAKITFMESIGRTGGELTPELRQQLKPVIAENIRVRQSHALSALYLDGITPEQFAAEHSNLDTAALLADPDMMRRVEAVSGRTDKQDAALAAQVQRTLRESVGILSTNLKAEDCTPAMARDFGDQLIKIAGMLDRRGDEGRKNTSAVRLLEIAFWDALITTPEGNTRVSLHSQPFNDIVVDLVSAMRCTTEAEVESVVGVLDAGPCANLTLSGF